MTFPFAPPLTPVPPGPRVIPEPPRRGEPGGEACGVCNRDDHIWSDENWALYNPVGCGISGTVWLASRVHADSFSDLPDDTLATFAPLAARIERAILGLGDVGRVHLYRWGDGGAHFHVWFMPRPLGMLEATKFYLPIWEEQLPPVPQEEIEAVGRKIAASLGGA
jgi:diadenosine tetraphosphate (Ap4A) HIT family hydrolase